MDYRGEVFVEASNSPRQALSTKDLYKSNRIKPEDVIKLTSKDSYVLLVLYGKRKPLRGIRDYVIPIAAPAEDANSSRAAEGGRTGTVPPDAPAELQLLLPQVPDNARAGWMLAEEGKPFRIAWQAPTSVRKVRFEIRIGANRCETDWIDAHPNGYPYPTVGTTEDLRLGSFLHKHAGETDEKDVTLLIASDKGDRDSRLVRLLSRQTSLAIRKELPDAGEPSIEDLDKAVAVCEDHKLHTLRGFYAMSALRTFGKRFYCLEILHAISVEYKVNNLSGIVLRDINRSDEE